MTAQGSARTRFARAVKTRNAFLAEVALREMGGCTLLEALDYLDLLAEAKAPKLEAAAVRWHGRLELEARTLQLPTRNSRLPRSRASAPATGKPSRSSGV